VQAAIGSGSYPRASALAAVRRVLAVKRTTNAPLTPASLTPANGSVGSTLTPALSGVLRDQVPGTDTATFYLRSRGFASWNVVNGATVAAAAGARAVYRVAAGRLAPSTSYEWSMRSCNAAGRCSAATPVLGFTTAEPPPPTATPTAVIG
jgi:hypothetical protein